MPKAKSKDQAKLEALLGQVNFFGSEIRRKLREGHTVEAYEYAGVFVEVVNRLYRPRSKKCPK